MKTLTIIAAVGALAVAVPAFADDTTPPSTPSAQQQCRTERTQIGKDAFAQLYGTNKNRKNAFGKCVSKRASATDKAAEQAHTNAAQSCQAERSADPAAFSTKYGTGKNGKNAFGKCVSALASQKTASTVKAEVKADVNAAKACKTERKADPQAFADKYGTNHNKRNAFGKCVSSQKKHQQSGSGDTTDDTSSDATQS
jgi:hypothetical protein